jgi:CxxC-x17-CxxC domain-containing protein
MGEYVKRGGPKRFGGKPSFGARSGKPAFAKKSWGDASSDAPKTFFKATCSNCGDSCEVPFRPVSGKPVFCRKCFVKTGDTAGGRAGDRFPRKEFHSRAESLPIEHSSTNTEILKQLELMNAKLERLITVLGSKSQ